MTLKVTIELTEQEAWAIHNVIQDGINYHAGNPDRGDESFREARKTQGLIADRFACGALMLLGNKFYMSDPSSEELDERVDLLDCRMPPAYSTIALLCKQEERNTQH